MPEQILILEQSCKYFFHSLPEKLSKLYAQFCLTVAFKITDIKVNYFPKGNVSLHFYISRNNYDKKYFSYCDPRICRSYNLIHDTIFMCYDLT
jgi:hypothetical protein